MSIDGVAAPGASHSGKKPTGKRPTAVAECENDETTEQRRRSEPGFPHGGGTRSEWRAGRGPATGLPQPHVSDPGVGAVRVRKHRRTVRLGAVPCAVRRRGLRKLGRPVPSVQSRVLAPEPTRFLLPVKVGSTLPPGPGACGWEPLTAPAALPPRGLGGRWGCAQELSGATARAPRSHGPRACLFLFFPVVPGSAWHHGGPLPLSGDLPPFPFVILTEDSPGRVGTLPPECKSAPIPRCKPERGRIPNEDFSLRSVCRRAAKLPRDGDSLESTPLDCTMKHTIPESRGPASFKGSQALRLPAPCPSTWPADFGTTMRRLWDRRLCRCPGGGPRTTLQPLWAARLGPMPSHVGVVLGGGRQAPASLPA
ncbi:uncharacterized protein AAES06_003497 [Glossophaga mutica]